MLHMHKYLAEKNKSNVGSVVGNEQFIPAMDSWETVMLNRSKPVELDDLLSGDVITDDVKNFSAFIFNYYQLIFYSSQHRAAYLDSHLVIGNIREAAKRLMSSKDGYLSDFGQNFVMAHARHQFPDQKFIRLDTQKVEQIAARIGLYKFFPKGIVALTLAVFGTQAKKWEVSTTDMRGVFFFTNDPEEFSGYSFKEIDGSEITLDPDMPSVWKWMHLVFGNMKGEVTEIYQFLDIVHQACNYLIKSAPALMPGYNYATPIANVLANLYMMDLLSGTGSEYETSRSKENISFDSLSMMLSGLSSSNYRKDVIEDRKHIAAFLRCFSENIPESERSTIFRIETYSTPIDFILTCRDFPADRGPQEWLVDRYIKSQLVSCCASTEAIEDQIKELRGNPTAVLDDEDPDSTDDEDTSDDEDPIDEENDDTSDIEDDESEDSELLTQGGDSEDGDLENNSIASNPAVGSAFSFIDLADKEKSDTLYLEAVYKACRFLQDRPDSSLVNLTPEGLTLLKDWTSRWMWVTSVEDTKRILKLLGIEDQFKLFSEKGKSQ